MTASYGVNGFTADHRAAFEKHGTERVYIAYDSDEAGDKAAAKLAEELMAMGIECFRVEFPKGMDANEYALKVTPAAKSLGVLLNRAAWLGKGQRPAARGCQVSEPLPAEAKAAAKEKIERRTTSRDANRSNQCRGKEHAAGTEEVFSLAADPEPLHP